MTKAVEKVKRKEEVTVNDFREVDERFDRQYETAESS